MSSFILCHIKLWNVNCRPKAYFTICYGVHQVVLKRQWESVLAEDTRTTGLTTVKLAVHGLKALARTLVWVGQHYLWLLWLTSHLQPPPPPSCFPHLFSSAGTIWEIAPSSLEGWIFLTYIVSPNSNTATGKLFGN